MFAHLARIVAFWCVVILMMSCTTRPITERICMGYYNELFEYMYDEDFDRAEMLECQYKQCNLRLFLARHDLVEILERYKEQTGRDVSPSDFLRILREWDMCPL
jgi:hypothetical protein